MTHYAYHQRYARDCREQGRRGPCQNVAAWLVCIDVVHWEPVCSFHLRDKRYRGMYEVRHRP